MVTTRQKINIIQKEAVPKDKPRSLESDIAKALAEANLLGAYGIRVKGFKLDAQKGLVLEPGPRYSQAELSLYRAKLEQEIGNHKTSMYAEGILERNLREPGEFTEKDFFKIVDNYEKGGSQNNN